MVMVEALQIQKRWFDQPVMFDLREKAGGSHAEEKQGGRGSETASFAIMRENRIVLSMA